ncbi:hypothetical protein L873DRAFT_1794074 [Choiromyces venosus 120613-1]|uniref:Uncharacterized protein n=1 Tax=Choiromyces venosus 120613-1 TaxID=1336337 RepID=A0A3N4J3L5_9PEZI|nr:hypothetical protein L873DRAFT_1794074 [Choiromyces venosus 120613-1]
MKSRLSEILGILILGLHSMAIPYNGPGNTLSSATVEIEQSQSLSTDAEPMITPVTTIETVVTVVEPESELGAGTAIVLLELELVPEAAIEPELGETATELESLQGTATEFQTFGEITTELGPVLATATELKSALEMATAKTHIMTTTTTTTFTTFSMSLELSIPPGFATANPYSPPHHFWDIDHSPTPLPYAHGRLTPGSLNSDSTRPHITVYCHEEYKYIYKWFNVTWTPVQDNNELCHKLKKELKKEGMLITKYCCREVGGPRSWEGGGERRMQATGRKPLGPAKDLGAVLWRAFKDYTVWYEGMDRGGQLCEV